MDIMDISRPALVPPSVGSPRRALIEVQGMQDAADARSVVSALRCIRGIEEVEVLLANAVARVRFDPSVVEPWQLHVAVHAVGFPNTVQLL